jgi:hypothetical protein
MRDQQLKIKISGIEPLLVANARHLAGSGLQAKVPAKNLPKTSGR